MEGLGYVNYYQVLNAKDYGVPQSRERVFTVSIKLNRAEYHSEDGKTHKYVEWASAFEFPPKQELGIRLKDILEAEVDEKYYLSDEQTKRLKMNKNIDVAEPSSAIVEDFYKSREPRFYAENAPTLRADRQGLKVAIRTANKKGYDMAQDGDSVDLAYPDSKTRRGRVGHGMSKTIATGDTMGTLTNDMRIRKLTPKECWRLMGFDDEDFEKAKAAGISNSQLYKQAGNSIVVNVLEGILRNLLTDH
jgi:DNA (cytosine-5)-methyltransferase 1